MPPKSKSKPRVFHELSWSVFHAKADFEIENLVQLHGHGGALRPPQGRRGFPEYPETPRFVIGRAKKGPLPSDIELFHSYWFISDRMKVLFETLDPEAFAFNRCDVSLADGTPGPKHWLCDVVRVLDAFAEPTRQQLAERNTKIFKLRDDRALVFDEQAIGSARFFRTPYMLPLVFCDDGVKQACKAGGMRGVRFKECSSRLRRQRAQRAVVH
jgi:hypothetical protein